MYFIQVGIRYTGFIFNIIGIISQIYYYLLQH